MPNLTNQRFGHLVVLKQTERNPKRSGVQWLCQCDCGNTIVRDTGYLRQHKSSACNDCRSIVLRERNLVHGDTLRHEGRLTSRLYQCWQNMRQRCYNRNNPDFKRYGGRGIRICEQWQSYIYFRDWSYANGYTDELTIDRIDVDKNYEPLNCEWVTKGENTRRRLRAGTTRTD